MILRFLLAALLCLPLSAWPQNRPSDPPGPPQTAFFPITPVAKANGARWRIGYYESGDYDEYSEILRAIATGLEELGWISMPAIPQNLGGRELWQFLSRNARSQTIEFVGDAYWKPANFDEASRPGVRQQVGVRLVQKQDIDLVIAMGTWAGQDMTALGAPVPTIVASTSDAVSARIVASAQDSGLENMHARVQPERYQRQLRLFHEIVGFRKLGLVYEDSPSGRSYAAVDAVRQIAMEKGFSVRACDARSSGVSAREATANVLHCYQELEGRVDAVYVTVSRGLTPAASAQLGQILREAKIPSFSMLGSEQVRAGLLMSLAQADYSYVGRFHAETIARILNGAKPRQLSQVWVDPAKIALNLETARLIGFEPTVDMLLAADEVYETR